MFIECEAALLAEVEAASFADALSIVNYWIRHADEVVGNGKPDPVTPRSASVSTTFDGIVDIRAAIDPVGGEIFLNEFERIEQVLFEADWAEARAIHGDATTIDDLARTPTQRRCDALVEMAKRSAAVAPGCVPLRASISVVVDHRSFATILETARGTVLSTDVVVPLLSDADIQRITFFGQDNDIKASRKRTFTGLLRQVIQLRDRHCQDTSGCDIPAFKCEIDHKLAASRGWRTELSNGQCLCTFHNKKKGAG